MMDLSQLSFPVTSKEFFGSSASSFVLTLNVSAQTNGTITGDIKDTNGAVLVGVKVAANKAKPDLSRTTTSEDEGRFVFPGMPVGLINSMPSLQVSSPSIFQMWPYSKRHHRPSICVMKVSSLAADLTVDSGEALVNTQTAELSYLVTEQAIQRLPLNGRNYTDLAFLTAWSDRLCAP